jgi:hypothetical protein
MCCSCPSPIARKGVARANAIVIPLITIAMPFNASVASLLGSCFSSFSLLTVSGVRFSPNPALSNAFPSLKSTSMKQGSAFCEIHKESEKSS